MSTSRTVRPGEGGTRRSFRTGYGRGDWWAIAAPDALLLLPPDSTASSIARGSAALAAGTDLAGLVDVLRDEGGLLDLPSFASVTQEAGRPRMLLRGLRAEVDGVVIDALDVLTWVETALAAESTVHIRAEPGAEVEEGLVLRDGVARCGAVMLELDPVAAALDGIDADSTAVEQSGAGDTARRPTEDPAEMPTAMPMLAAAGSLVLPDGSVRPLDKPVVIGRGPAAATARAHFVPVQSPTKDVSRRHVEVRLEGETAVVVDLATSNGTTLLRSGRPPLRLTGRQAQVLLDQDVIDLGDDVRVRYVVAGADD